MVWSPGVCYLYRSWWDLVGSIRFKWHLDSFFKFGWSLGDVVAQQRWGCCTTDEPHGLKTTRRPNNRVRGKSPERWLLHVGDTSLHSPGHCQNLEIFLILLFVDETGISKSFHVQHRPIRTSKEYVKIASSPYEDNVYMLNMQHMHISTYLHKFHSHIIQIWT